MYMMFSLQTMARGATSISLLVWMSTVLRCGRFILIFLLVLIARGGTRSTFEAVNMDIEGACTNH